MPGPEAPTQCRWHFRNFPWTFAACALCLVWRTVRRCPVAWWPRALWALCPGGRPAGAAVSTPACLCGRLPFPPGTARPGLAGPRAWPGSTAVLGDRAIYIPAGAICVFPASHWPGCRLQSVCTPPWLTVGTWGCGRVRSWAGVCSDLRPFRLLRLLGVGPRPALCLGVRLAGFPSEQEAHLVMSSCGHLSVRAVLRVTPGISAA